MRGQQEGPREAKRRRGLLRTIRRRAAGQGGPGSVGKSGPLHSAVIWLTAPEYCEDLLVPALNQYRISVEPFRDVRRFWARQGVRNAAELAAWIRRHEDTLAGARARQRQQPDPARARPYALLYGRTQAGILE
eukprot:5425051-Lingulodinium_polyedra.AAC.1